MRYFESAEKAQEIVELVKGYGFKNVKYTTFGTTSENFTLAGSPFRYVNVAFSSDKGFYMSTTGTWIEGEEKMQQVQHEAQMVNEIIKKINGILNGVEVPLQKQNVQLHGVTAKRLDRDNLIAHVDGLEPYWLDIVTLNLEAGTVVVLDKERAERTYSITEVELYERLD